jgi:hypothetical protein
MGGLFGFEGFYEGFDFYCFAFFFEVDQVSLFVIFLNYFNFFLNFFLDIF